MFLPCIIRRSIKNQHCAQIYTTDLFHMLGPACFGSSLQSSGSFWIRVSYMKIQIGLVVYNIMLGGLCAGVCQLSWEAQQTELTLLQNTGHLTNII
jgi:hypothetical protein